MISQKVSVLVLEWETTKKDFAEKGNQKPLLLLTCHETPKGSL